VGGVGARRIVVGLVLGILAGSLVGVTAVVVGGDSSLSMIGSVVGAFVGVSYITSGRRPEAP
jgi:hypothetical protein